MLEVTGLVGNRRRRNRRRRYCCRRSRARPRCQSANLLLPLPLRDVVGHGGHDGLGLFWPRPQAVAAPRVRPEAGGPFSFLIDFSQS
eukprot:5452256-Pyramimonas_sp.AAC.6